MVKTQKMPRRFPMGEGCPSVFTLRYVAECGLVGGARPDIVAHVGACAVCADWIDYYRSQKQEGEGRGS